MIKYSSPTEEGKTIMPLLHWKTVLATALCVAAYSQPGLAQVAPAILEIVFANRVGYNYDTDYSAFTASPDTVIPATPQKNLRNSLLLADIVSVNGKPAKGVFIERATFLGLTPNPTPGQAVADNVRSVVSERHFDILQADGTPVGSITCSGPGGGTAAPGGPLAASASSYAIAGGTGAFIGVRGQVVDAGTLVAGREGSAREDPANRRINGGGTRRALLQLIPMTRPEVAIIGGSPAIYHADFSPVTTVKPAKAGEVLITRATGLGPTRPGIDPGQPFPLDATQEVNSPVDVTMNGKSADVINKIGWPGLVDTYRVDFRVPDGTTPGTAALQLTAAWIAGTAVNVPIQ